MVTFPLAGLVVLYSKPLNTLLVAATLLKTPVNVSVTSPGEVLVTLNNMPLTPLELNVLLLTLILAIESIEERKNPLPMRGKGALLLASILVKTPSSIIAPPDSSMLMPLELFMSAVTSVMVGSISVPAPLATRAMPDCELELAVTLVTVRSSLPKVLLMITPLPPPTPVPLLLNDESVIRPLPMALVRLMPSRTDPETLTLLTLKF